VSTSEIITAMATYPVADAAMVAFEGQGAACPSGHSGNLVMLKITPSAIATAWCAAFSGSSGGGQPHACVRPVRPERPLGPSVLIGKYVRFSALAAAENRRGSGLRSTERSGCSPLSTQPSYLRVHTLTRQPAGDGLEGLPGVNRDRKIHLSD
jgi:hypothetical protein